MRLLSKGYVIIDTELEIAQLEAPSLYEIKGHVYIREI